MFSLLSQPLQARTRHRCPTDTPAIQNKSLGAVGGIVGGGGGGEGGFLTLRPISLFF